MTLNRPMDRLQAAYWGTATASLHSGSAGALASAEEFLDRLPGAGQVAWPATVSRIEVVPEGLSVQQTAWLKATLTCWQKALGSRLTLTLAERDTKFRGGGEIQVSCVEQGPSERRAISGWCDRQVTPDGRWITSAQIYLVGPVLACSGRPDWMRAARWQRTLAHELGHALGLEHMDQPEDLMFGNDLPRLWLNHHLGPGDYRQLARRYP